MSSTMKLRPTRDVSSLPTVTFGPRSLMWWGTLGFMTIEGWTTVLLVGAYLYLRQNYEAWPPLRTPYPSLGVPTAESATRPRTRLRSNRFATG